MSGDQGEAAVLTEAVGRVEAFLSERKRASGLDPDHIVGMNYEALRVGDLRAVLDRLAALTADNDRLRDRLDAIEAACDDADRRGQMLGSQAVRRLVRGTR